MIQGFRGDRLLPPSLTHPHPMKLPQAHELAGDVRRHMIFTNDLDHLSTSQRQNFEVGGNLDHLAATQREPPE
jgi:hypothetical protein